MNVQLKCLFLFLFLYPFHLCHSWKNNNPLFWIHGGSRRMSNNTTNHKMSSSKEEKEVVSSHISTTGGDGDDESERVYQLMWEEAKLDMKDTENNKTKKRMDYLSWDDYFMSIAFLSAQRSKDPDHQRGACIVNAEHQIVGIGYNGFPRGCHDDCLPWSDTSHSELHTKHPFLCPAEVNAILNKCSENVQGATLYVHQFPGNESAKVIIQAGIRQVVYMENTLEQVVSRKASRILFQMANVQTRQYTPTLTTIDLDFGTSHEPQSYNDKTTQQNIQEIKNKYRDLLLEEANYDPTSIQTGKREGYLSWDDYFMSVAFLSAKRSKDPSTQVGACIVNSDKNIIGIGYNGFPRGCSDDHLPWSRSSDCSSLHTKYPYVVHAEVNAILNKCSANVQGATLYVALFPCNDCAKVIIQAGITEVVYLSDKYHDTDQCRASRVMFQMAGVKLRQYFPQRKKITISFVSKS